MATAKAKAKEKVKVKVRVKANMTMVKPPLPGARALGTTLTNGHQEIPK
jgi:hypothetical protein